MNKSETAEDDDEVENPSPAQIVASIDDILIEIIQRIPLKPLVQLKLVSKHWNSLISDPKLCFSRNRPAAGLIFEGLNTVPCGYIDATSNHPHSYTIFLDKSKSPSSFTKMTPTEDPWYRYCKILHSCNGLLACVSNPANDLTRKYYICNPTTKHFSTLPQVPDVSNKTTRGVLLAFDPSKSPHYKVVCVFGLSGRSSRFLEVYSSETGSWGECGELKTANAGFDLDFQDGVYWNGAIHWVNIVRRPRECIYFNPEDFDQGHKEFPMPPVQDRDYRRDEYYFGESCDHLHFVDSCGVVDEFNVYEMKRDYSEWFVKYKVNVPDEMGTYRCNVVRGLNDEDSFLVFVLGMEIGRYDFGQRTFETLVSFESIAQRETLFLDANRPFQYIMSLCSV